MRLLMTFILAAFCLWPPARAGESGDIPGDISVQRQAERADIFFKRGMYRDALDVAQDGLAVSPAYLPFWKTRARAHFGLGDYEQTLKDVAVWRYGEPDNAEAVGMQVLSSLRLSGEADKASVRDLTRIMDSAKVEQVVASLRDWAAGDHSQGHERDNLLDALLASDSLTPQAAKIVRNFRDGKPREAARLMRNDGSVHALGVYAGLIHYLVGRDLAYTDASDQALPLLEKAQAENFLPGDCARLIHGIHRANGQPERAAHALEAYWRKTANPGRAASVVADDYLAAGDPEGALVFLDSAQKALPKLPALQAKHLASLHAAGREDDFAAYAAELEQSGQQVGLGYGRALVARADGDFRKAERELVAVSGHVRNVMGHALHTRDVESWIESGQRALDSLGTESAGLSYNLGTRLWNQELPDRAFASWGKSFDNGRSLLRTNFLATAQRLLANGQPAEALAFMRRNVPEFRPVDLAFALYKNNRWTDLKTLADDPGYREGPGAEWKALFKAVAAFESDPGEDVPEYLGRPVRELSSLSPQRGNFEFQVVNKDDSLGTEVLTPDDYDKMALDVATHVVQARRKDLFPFLLDSKQWSGANARVGAAEIGLAFFRSGQREEAMQFVERLPEERRRQPDVAFFIAQLAMRNNKPLEAASIVHAALPKAKGVVREQLLALRARIDNDRLGAANHSLSAARIDPADNALRLDAVGFLAYANEYEQAQILTRRLELQQLKGGWDVATYLAQSWMELGKFDKALPIWKRLYKRRPKSVPALGGLLRTYNELEMPQETLRLTDAAMEAGTVEIAGLMAEANMALSRPKAALEWINMGLRQEPENLRLLNLGARCCEIMEDNAGLEKYACRYVAIDPDASTMHVLYGQALVNQEKWKTVIKHNRWLLRRNKINWAALEREAERLKALECVEENWNLDRYIAQVFGNDGGIVIRSAISAAGAGEFRCAIPILERLMRYGPNASALSLYFGQVALGEGTEAMDFPRFLEHLDMISVGHCFAGTEAYLRTNLQTECTKRLHTCKDDDTCPRKVPLVVIVGRNRPEVIQQIDDALAARDGKAILIVGEESLQEVTSDQWPNASFLRTLAATGRWEFVLTDNAPGRYPANEDGKWTTFWTQRRWLGNVKETSTEMKQRLQERIRRIKKKAQGVCIEVKGWAHPGWGDYGQRVVMGDPIAKDAYLNVIGCEFEFALTQTPVGYRMPETDKLRIPMRSVGKLVDPNELWFSTAYQHPTRRAVLELAKVKSWHGQLPEADRLFNLARCYFTDPKEYSYFQARNSQFMGDVPMAIALSHEARRIDPANERTTTLIQDTHRLLRPLLSVEARHWSDSNHQKYTELDATLSWHINPKWELRVRAGFHRWKPRAEDQEGSDPLHGISLGFGARWYFKPLNWLQGEVRAVNVGGDVGSIPEVKLTWHGNYTIPDLRMNGEFNLIYSHEMIESYRAIQEKITADRLAFNTHFRFRDWWEADFETYYINRSDGNDTLGVMFRPTYRFLDVPLLRAGYWFAAADSDRNPDEYYAPVGYQAHQAVVMYRQTFCENLTINALAAFGRAKTASTGWRNVLRGNIGFNYQVNECLSFGGSYSHLKLPDYTLNSFNMNVNIRF